ncbi:hypothetical protein GIB67_037566, partial [Kingdonia uniflora]
MDITHLLYADDFIVFLNGGKSSITGLMEFLRRYEACTGQKINKAKSGIFMHHSTPATRKTIIQTHCGIQMGTFPNLYLGAPICYGRMRIAHFDSLIRRVQMKIEGWKGKLLSAGDKLIFINHVLNSMPIHLLSSSHVPQTIFKRLEMMFANFFWGSYDRHPKRKWVAWGTICRPKDEGGVAASNLWKGIYGLIETVKTNTAWVLGKGDISFWFEDSTGNGALCDCTATSIHQQIKVNEVLDENGVWHWESLQAELSATLEDSLTHKFKLREEEDKPIWAESIDGNFTTKSAWNFWRTKDPLFCRADWIWHAFISIPDERYDEYRRSSDFIKEYIFPGGCLPSLSRLTSAMAAGSRLCVEHLENIGIHYYQTLIYWRDNFMAKQSKILELGFDERFIRTWEYYFVYCAAGFKTYTLGNYQIVFSRPGNMTTFSDSYKEPISQNAKSKPKPSKWLDRRSRRDGRIACYSELRDRKENDSETTIGGRAESIENSSRTTNDDTQKQRGVAGYIKSFSSGE